MDSMLKSCEQVWRSCLDIIRDNVSEHSFKTWFEPIKPVRILDSVLTIQVPSQFFYEWLEEHYVNLLHKTIKREMGVDGRLEYNIVMDNSGGQPITVNLPAHTIKNKAQEVTVPLNVVSSIKNPFVIPGLKKLNIESQLSPSLTFDSLVEGESNRLARSAGMAVAQKPGGTSFNPLMIYGQTGLGKTHLAQAIGNQIKQNFPQKTVLYVTSDKFSNQLVDAIKGGSAPDFINFYQLIDVLIVDDIQFFGGKEKTQEMFFHIFNHLHQNGKQLVLTCDRPPKDLKGMADRLLSRFKWGLSVDIQAPDLETRIAILEKKMYASGIDLPRDVVEFVAHNVTTNVRELEGALNSLLLNSTINKKEPTLDIAKQVMKNFVKNISMEISIESIQALVCEYFKIQQEALKSKSRKREIVQARQISMYFAKKMTKNSLKTIGEFFGGRDHSTVIHSCQTVEDLMETDRSFRGYVEEINKQIKLSTL